MKLARFVLDEAHCILEWGHGFRVSYLCVLQLSKIFPSFPITALTATITKKEKDELIKSLNLNNPSIFVSSLVRKNLFFQVLDKTSQKQAFIQIGELLTTVYYNQSGIVYCFSQLECDKFTKTLNESVPNLNVANHAGLIDVVREKSFADWKQETVKFMCSTIAFRMGIYKPDVRFVIPKSLEGLMQKSGRAGRNGINSKCYMLSKSKKMNKSLNEMKKKKEQKDVTVDSRPGSEADDFVSKSSARKKTKRSN